MGSLQTYIDQDQYDELIRHSGVVRTERVHGQFFEGRQCDDGSLIVAAHFGVGAILLYTGIPSFATFFRELREAGGVSFLVAEDRS